MSRVAVLAREGYSVETLRAQRLSVRRVSVVLVCLGALVAGASWGVGWQSGSAASPRLVVEVAGEALAGEPIEVRIVIHDANGISGFDATIGFDTTIATLQGIQSQDNDLARLGRDVKQLGPVEVPGGIAVGAYSCPFNDCADVAGKQRNKDDGKGTLLLSTFTLVAQQAGPLTIDLTSARFAGASGNLVEVDLSGALVTVEVMPNGGGE